MALVVKDRVRETTTTTGTGTLTLSGAVTGFQSFSNALSDGDTTYYGISEGSTGNWEVGLGTFTSSGTTLARTTVLASSNSGSAINLTATADVFITQPAGKAAYFDGSGDLVLNQDPTANLQAATKQYVDTIAAAGLHYHDPVRVEQEGNLNATYDNGTSGVGATLTNAGTQAALVIDGVTMVLNDRVLIYEQTNAAHNGIYTVTNVGSASTNWVLTRATDADSYGPSDPDALGQGDAFFVSEGDAGAGETYVMTTEGTITFGTTDITFSQISATQVYSAGNGLTLTGTTFAVGQGTGVTVNANDIAIGQDVGTTADVTFNSVSASLTGNVTGNLTGNVTGNADTATAWATSRTVSLTGDVTGSATGVDGSGNVSIATTIAADSVALGTDTTGNYVQQGATSGNGISGSVNSEGGTFTVTSNATSANTASTTVFRDASGNFSAGTITADGLTIDNSTQTSFNVEYADDGSGVGPLLRTFRDSASPAADDLLGGLDFKGNDSGGSETFYSRIMGRIVDPTDGSEDGAVDINVAKAGTAAWATSGLVARFNSDGMYLRDDIIFEGATSNASQTTLTVTDPTADRTITLPDATGTVWTSGNDGSGSGLDADTVDGIQASSFLRSDAADTATGTITISTGTSPALVASSDDWGEQLEINRANSSVNWPSIKFSNDSGELGRIFVDASNDYLKYVKAGTSNYETVWTNYTDGAGSGLDADLLDGVQGSSYLRSDASDTYTSGTLTFSNGTALDLATNDAYANLRVVKSSNSSSPGLFVGYANAGSGNTILYGGGSTSPTATVTSSSIEMQESHYVNLRFEVDPSSATSVAYIILCRNAANNDVNGTITMDRTSGLRFACSWDIIVSSGSSTTPLGSLVGHSLAGAGQPSARLVTLTYSSVSYVALELTNPDQYYESTGAYFNGRIVNSGSNTFTVVTAGQVSAISSMYISTSRTIMSNNLEVGNSIYVPNQIIHDGDDDTNIAFGTNVVSISAGGSQEVTVTATGVQLGDTGNGYFQPVTGTFGSIQIDGGAHSGYEGYSIGGVAVWMTDSATYAGLYNDANNQWWMRGIFNGQTDIYYQGTSKLNTTSSGINVTGTAEVDTLTFSDGSSQTSAGASTGKAIAMAIVFG
jgi:hypothetical protein